MSAERFGGVRARIALEAARLMVEEEIKQYFTAKRMAAKRLFGRQDGRRLAHFRPHDLPSNGEIRDAILRLAELEEGRSRYRRLFAMRALALEVMKELEPFKPRLIGSVSTGHVRKGSDIDLHVFPDDEEPLQTALRRLGWPCEREVATIQKHGAIREYVHYHIDLPFLVELTVYEPREMRQSQRSSTDGKPIVRFTPRALLALIEREHPEAWARYKAFITEGPNRRIVEGDPGGFADPDAANHIAELDLEIEGEADDEEADMDSLLGPEPGEAEDPDQDYDPLPGFEMFSKPG